MRIFRLFLIVRSNALDNLGAMDNDIKTGKRLSNYDIRVSKGVLMVQNITNLVPL